MTIFSGIGLAKNPIYLRIPAKYPAAAQPPVRIVDWHINGDCVIALRYNPLTKPAIGAYIRQAGTTPADLVELGNKLRAAIGEMGRLGMPIFPHFLHAVVLGVSCAGQAHSARGEKLKEVCTLLENNRFRRSLISISLDEFLDPGRRAITFDIKTGTIWSVMEGKIPRFARHLIYSDGKNQLIEFPDLSRYPSAERIRV